MISADDDAIYIYIYIPLDYDPFIGGYHAPKGSSDITRILDGT